MYAAMALERVKNEATWLGYKFQKKEYSEYQEKLIEAEKAEKEAKKAEKKAEKEAKKAEKKTEKASNETGEKKFNIREFLKRKPKEDVREESAEDVSTGEKIQAEKVEKTVEAFHIDPEAKEKVFEFKTVPTEEKVSFSYFMSKIRRTKPAVFNDVRNTANGDNDMMIKIKNSEEIFDYCMYLMKEDGEEATMFKTDDEEFMKFCNCICYIAAKYIPYSDTEIGYTSWYNPSDEEFKGIYLMTINDFKANNIITDPDDQCPFEEDKAEEVKLDDESTFKFKPEKELECPIRFFDFSKEKEENASEVNEEVAAEKFTEQEKVFRDIIGKADHYWERYNGIYKLFITRSEDKEDQYIIDDGRVMGTSSYSILADTDKSDTIFVPISMRNICKKILKGKENVLNDKEVKSIASKFFTNDIIYRYIDFSEVGSTIDLFTDEESAEFQNRLKLIVDDMIEKANGELNMVPRLRFIELKNNKEFTLVSDDKVVSPLKEIGATSAVMVDGLKYVSTDKTIDQYTNNSSKPTLTMNIVNK